MTKQKALMLSIFRSDFCHGKHRTADEILAYAKDLMPGISRATVYNNLKELAKEGIIRRISGDDGADLYDSDTSLHGHLICSVCKGVRDVGAPRLFEDLKRISGEDIEAYELKLRYVCESCRHQNLN